MPLHRAGRPYGGFPDFGYLDTFRPQAPYQLFGTESHNISPSSLGYSATGPPSYDPYRQHYSSVLYGQTGRDPFPHPVMSSSGSVPMASNSGHSHQGQAHSRLSECDGRPSVLDKSANNQITTQWSLHPEMVNCLFGTWEAPTVDMFATVHNTHFSQFMSPILESITGDRWR